MPQYLSGTRTQRGAQQPLYPGYPGMQHSVHTCTTARVGNNKNLRVCSGQTRVTCAPPLGHLLCLYHEGVPVHTHWANNFRQFVPECKWKENVKWLSALALVRAIPGCKSAGVPGYKWRIRCVAPPKWK
eukprot:1098838-Rhodomonas_salina.1